MADSYNWIYARDLREIPEWIKKGHSWHNAVPFENLQKLQMKVRMCCSKCEEKVKEEIREVEGVFDVRAEKAERKVVVVVTPERGNVEREVLRKARKVDKKAQFVELDAQEKPDKDQKEKGDGDGKKKTKERPKGGTSSGDGTVYILTPTFTDFPLGFDPRKPLPGRPYWSPSTDRQTPAPPPGYFPTLDIDTRDVATSSQHRSTEVRSTSPTERKPKQKPGQKPKQRSMLKKVIRWLFG